MTSSVTPYFSFSLEQTDGNARAGVFQTPHGAIHTPIFMPVGTHSTVKTLTWNQVQETGAQIVLCNAYHLYLKPGHGLVAQGGGLHQWMNWSKPILTDSGGFQVFSLAQHRKIEPDGVRFKDPVTGSTHFIGPKESMAIQNALGADIIMAFDECPPYPVSHESALKSMDLTHRWLERCFASHQRPHDQALFPIVQGSTFLDLREKAVNFVSALDAVGYAIGGVSVGEPREEMHRITAHTAPLLPSNKPRYLMGVGTIEDLLQGIASGVDMFDCVMPTRVARHGAFFTPEGRVNLKIQAYEADFSPLVEGCGCFACQHHTKAYIRHLYRQGETTAKALLSIHNLHYLIDLSQQARQAILNRSFDDFYHQTLARLSSNVPSTTESMA